MTLPKSSSIASFENHAFIFQIYLDPLKLGNFELEEVCVRRSLIVGFNFLDGLEHPAAHS